MKILIDKELLDYESPLSKGLLQGLIKLEELGYSFYVKERFKTINKINSILKIEKIELFESNDDNEYFDLIINTVQEGESRKIVVGVDKCENFNEVVSRIISNKRTANIERITKETNIKVYVALDNTDKVKIHTGIGFFDHMLEQISKHGNLNLQIEVKGDLNVDEHHTVEDVGIALGNAIKQALGDKKGIKRYGFLLPMDESIAKCAIDLGGRTYLNFKCKFNREMVGNFPTELTEEFFRGLASGMSANIFIRCKGKNDHHKIENIFKAFAKSLNEACRLDERVGNKLPSTKGVL